MRILLFTLLFPLALMAQTRTKILVVTPNAVALNSSVVRVLNSNQSRPDSLVAKARKVFGTMAKPDLSDFSVYVTGVDDSLSLKPVLVNRSTILKVKKRNFITKKERVVGKKVKYKGVQIGPDEKLVLEGIAKKFGYDYVVFVSYFEVKNNKSLNLAFKPLSVFAVHYEVYDSKLAFKTGNVVEDAFSVSSTMQLPVLYHYLNLSAENVYRNVSSIIGFSRLD